LAGGRGLNIKAGLFSKLLLIKYKGFPLSASWRSSEAPDKSTAVAAAKALGQQTVQQ
jgi:hypothetical protein